MYKNDIGINAGVIWRLLSEKRTLSLREIGELTNYKDSFIALSLGWLARENKIIFKEIGETVFIELYEISPEMYY